MLVAGVCPASTKGQERRASSTKGGGGAVHLHRRHQDDPVRLNDFGIQHICLYVDDIDAAAAQLRAAGGVLLTVRIEERAATLRGPAATPTRIAG
jgi:catechol 2,3-dioxygenase-like lactoylglutathione lyase family enzyme